MNTPLSFEATISVIVPVRGKYELLMRALKSLLNQEYAPIEIIVIDDSSDSSQSAAFNEVIRDFSLLLSDCQLGSELIVLNSKGQGVSSARNLGIRNAKSKYIAFLDADDYFFANHLSLQLQYLESTNLDFVHSNYIVSHLNPSRTVVDTSINSGTDQASFISFRQCVIATPTVMIRRSVLTNYGKIFPEQCDVGEDAIAWARFAKLSGKPFGHIRTALTFVTVTKQSSRNNLDMIGKAKQSLLLNARIEGYRKLRILERNTLKLFIGDLFPANRGIGKFLRLMYSFFNKT